MSEIELMSPEVIAPNALAMMEKVAVDVQIATAKQWPRSIKQFKVDAIDLATQDEEIATSCLYSRPVGGGKNAEGMSIRMAEIVSASYGNMIVGARIVEQTDRYVIAQGVAHDLQKNVRTTTEVKESTVKANGEPYSERQSVVVAKVALAKARRDAIFQVVPRALCKPVENAVRNLLFGDGKSLDKRREMVKQWVKNLGIDPKRVLCAIDAESFDTIGAEHLETINGLRTAIKDNDTTVDEAFPFESDKDEDEKKDLEEMKRQESLNKHKKTVLPNLLVYPINLIKEEFENSGFVSEKTEDKDIILDLVNQLNSRARLDTIIRAIEIKSKEQK